jgi:ribosomal protein S10
MTTPRIRIRLEAYDHKLLDRSAADVNVGVAAGEIVETANPRVHE